MVKNNNMKQMMLLTKRLLLSFLLFIFFIPNTNEEVGQIFPHFFLQPIAAENKLNLDFFNNPLFFSPIIEPEKVVYLTFDDGPTLQSGQLLDMLHQYDAKATFFMLAPKMKKHPNFVNRMMKEGFAVGLHGVTHDANLFYRSKESALQEMVEAQKVLQEITGENSMMIRTPYGSIPYLLDSYREAIETYGFQIWDWHIDSRDWELNEHSYVEKTIEEIEKLTQEGKHPVVLLHELNETLEHLPELLSYLRENNFQMKTLNDSIEPIFFECNNRCYEYGSEKKEK